MLGMMFLAALVDLPDARARRAALHEVNRRTEPPAESKPVDLETPPFGTLMLEGMRMHMDSSASKTSLRSALDTLSTFSSSFIAAQMRAILVRFTDVPLAVVEDDLGDEDGDSVSVVLPEAEVEAYRTALRAGVPFVATLRTEADPILAAFWAADVPKDLLLAFWTSASSVADWMSAERPNLTGWSASRILDASRAWHAQFRASLFRAPCPDALVLVRYPDGWTLQRLTEKADLAAEGESMGHCVGGPLRANGRPDGESVYWQAVRDDRASILSLRDPKGVPHVTLELVNKGGRIVQVQGPEDRHPDAESMRRVRLALYRLSGWQDAVPSAESRVLAKTLVEASWLRTTTVYDKANGLFRHLQRELERKGPMSSSVNLVFRLLDALREVLREMRRVAKAIVFPSGDSFGWARTGPPEQIVLPPEWGTPLGGFSPPGTQTVSMRNGDWATASSAYAWLFWSERGLTVRTWWCDVSMDSAIEYPNLESFLYGFTGFESAAPDTSSIKVLGSLGSKQTWASLTRMRLAIAREMRSVQGRA